MKENKKIKAALYLRVKPTNGSPTDILETEESFREQEKLCRKFCQSQNIEINEDHVYRDVCEGDESLHFRSGLRDLIYTPAEKRDCDIVVVSRLDRLARRTKTLLEILDEVELGNLGFRSAMEPFDSTASGRHMLNMLGVFSEMERESIRKREATCDCDCHK